jgi:hypothetical protein
MPVRAARSMAMAREIFSFQRSAPTTTRRMSSGTLRLSEALVVRRCSFVVRVRRTVSHPRRGPFGSAAPVGLVFRRNPRWGCAGVTGHTASRNSAGSTTGGAASRLAAVCGPARSGTNVAVKIAGQQRYITDSKTAAKPSPDFTVRCCQAFGTPFFGKWLQTIQIELKNKLHSRPTVADKTARSRSKATNCAGLMGRGTRCEETRA